MIQSIKNTAQLEESKKLKSRFEQFNAFIEELNSKEIPENIESNINDRIGELNNFQGTAKQFSSQIRKTLYKIIKLVEKELKLVPKNHYRNQWMAIGMSVFGVPMGVAFGASMGNMAFLGIGLPIGMVIGMAFGVEKDKKAAAEGLQLDIESAF